MQRRSEEWEKRPHCRRAPAPPRVGLIPRLTAGHRGHMLVLDGLLGNGAGPFHSHLCFRPATTASCTWHLTLWGGEGLCSCVEKEKDSLVSLRSDSTQEAPRGGGLAVPGPAAAVEVLGRRAGLPGAAGLSSHLRTTSLAEGLSAFSQSGLSLLLLRRHALALFIGVRMGGSYEHRF